jgi:hypothetical protein
MATQDLDAIERLIQSDPEIQAAINQVSSSPAGQAFLNSGRPNAAVQAPIQNVRQVIEERLAANGLELPNDFFYSVREGQLNKEGFLERNSNWVLPLMFSAGIGTGLAVGPTAVATSGSAAVPSASAAIPAATGPGSAGLFTAPTAAGLPPGALASAAGSGGGSFLGGIGGTLRNRITDPDFWGEMGEMVQGATQAAGQNRHASAQQNIPGQTYYERDLAQRSRLEMDQREQAGKDLYRASWYGNRQSGPYNPRPPQPISANYQQGLTALEQQALSRITKAPEYGTDTMRPLNREEYQIPEPGMLERIGTWASPAMSIFERIMRGPKPEDVIIDESGQFPNGGQYPSGRY